MHIRMAKIQKKTVPVALWYNRFILKQSILALGVATLCSSPPPLSQACPLQSPEIPLLAELSISQERDPEEVNWFLKYFPNEMSEVMWDCWASELGSGSGWDRGSAAQGYLAFLSHSHLSGSGSLGGHPSPSRCKCLSEQHRARPFLASALVTIRWEKGLPGWHSW